MKLRGKQIIDSRGDCATGSLAVAVCNHVHNLYFGTPDVLLELFLTFIG